MIDERPVEVETRKEQGHWEIDTLEALHGRSRASSLSPNVRRATYGSGRYLTAVVRCDWPRSQYTTKEARWLRHSTTTVFRLISVVALGG